jgi:hypothetical protein
MEYFQVTRNACTNGDTRTWPLWFIEALDKHCDLVGAIWTIRIKGDWHVWKMVLRTSQTESQDINWDDYLARHPNGDITIVLKDQYVQGYR